MHPVPPRSSPNIATTRVLHPSDADAVHHGGGGRRASYAADQPAVYTVWKRSSMGFQGTYGFSVYDAAGALAFRVDNYSRRRKLFAGELLLMYGHAGAPLLALRPQILSMRDQWNCYRESEEAGDKGTTRRQQLFSMRKCSLVQSEDEAEVHMCTTAPSDRSSQQIPSFRVQGSF